MPEHTPTDSSEPAVRPLDPSGEPIAAVVRARSRSRRGTWVAGGIVASIVIVAVGAVVLWRAIIGSPYGAAEAVPADADIVITMDFLQIRDTEQVERFIQAFAAPMAKHGIIDQVPDFEAALRQFDDEAEAELGFRFAEDVFSWIGRSGAVALWFPDSMFDFDVMANEDVVPAFLATLQVRDEEGARAFLERMIAEAVADGIVTESIVVAGSPGYVVRDEDAPVFVVVHDGRFLLADSLETLRRAVETDASQSVAQTSDFQEFSAALGGDPLMTMYASASLGEQVTAAYDEMGLDLPFGAAATSGMATVALDADGIVVRGANRVIEDLPVGAGQWARDLPAGTYGFFDVVLPDAYLAELADLYLDVLGEAGFTGADVDAITAPVDEALGMSLLDDLLPQFGREIVFAVGPAADGLMAGELGFDVGLGVLFGIGVEDAAVVSEALDSAVALVEQQGIRVVDRNGVRIAEADGAQWFALTVTEDAFAASSSPDMLESFVRGEGALGDTAQYRRVDDLVDGDGLAMYVDVAAIVADFAGDDEEVRDILAPLQALGASYEVSGSFQLTEFRVVVDY